MSKDIHIADVVIHLHPERSCNDHDRIERDLRAHDGVISVHFSTKERPHAVVVAYDSDAVSSQTILAVVRQCDQEAAMAGI